MRATRLEAFSDGVLAVIITILVLDLRVPHAPEWAALRPLWPIFLTYVLSFVNLGIYWNNHHHMFQVTRQVNGAILWANLHLLFWLSLVPFTTGWMGENHFAPLPTAVYGADLLLAGIAYFILQHVIIRSQGRNSVLAAAIGRDLKGKLSPVLYALAIPAAFVRPAIAGALYAAVALMWLLPDKRIERMVAAGKAAE
ncbi:MAG TPA: TMEM175 family protein [Longimicrobiales bacterium]|nr:TMEM175 family protein [Longimicrobiales bacterium]